MTCHRICAQQRQPCPSAWLCSEGCNFNNEIVPMQSAQERAAAEFWKVDLPADHSNPGYPFAWLDELLNLWDDLTWWQAALFVIGLIVVCGMVAGVLAGYRK